MKYLACLFTLFLIGCSGSSKNWKPTEDYKPIRFDQDELDRAKQAYQNRQQYMHQIEAYARQRNPGYTSTPIE